MSIGQLTKQLKSLTLTSAKFSSHCKFEAGDQLGQYEVVKMLGRGRFSTVWESSKGSQSIAIKVYRMGRDNTRYYENEVMVLNRIFEHSLATSVNPPNLVGYLGTFVHISMGIDRAPVFHPCVMFSLAGESVSKLLRWCSREHDSGLPLHMVKRIMRNVLTGLAYMHSIDIIHTDIKPENLLLNCPMNAIDENFSVLISDLGSSTLVNNLFSMHVGTDGYCAPELVLELPYTPAIDIWAAFATCYELITSILLFDINGECDIDYGLEKSKKSEKSDSEGSKSHSNNDPMDTAPLCTGCDAGCEYCRAESNSSDSGDYWEISYAHLLLFETILGRPPEEIISNGRLYYNSRGRLKNNPEVSTVRLNKLLQLNCELSDETAQQIEDFLLTGLRYTPETRITAEQALQHPWLN